MKASIAVQFWQKGTLISASSTRLTRVAAMHITSPVNLLLLSISKLRKRHGCVQRSSKSNSTKKEKKEEEKKGVMSQKYWWSSHTKTASRWTWLFSLTFCTFSGQLASSTVVSFGVLGYGDAKHVYSLGELNNYSSTSSRVSAKCTVQRPNVIINWSLLSGAIFCTRADSLHFCRVILN